MKIWYHILEYDGSFLPIHDVQTHTYTSIVSCREAVKNSFMLDYSVNECNYFGWKFLLKKMIKGITALSRRRLKGE